LNLFDCSICSDWNIHQKKASKGREKYRHDSENIINSNTLCGSADLQKVIMLPRLEMFKRAIFTQRRLLMKVLYLWGRNLRPNLLLAYGMNPYLGEKRKIL
jgi:hypothetical protein